MWVLRAPDDFQPRPLTIRILPGSVKTIGRSPAADFMVDVPMMSRIHCRFTANPDGALEIEDLGSTNGTFVNDERVAKARLNRGDRLRIGRLELVVERNKNDE